MPITSRLRRLWRHNGLSITLLVLFLLERATLVNGSLLTGPQIDTYDNRLALTSAQAFLLRQPVELYQVEFAGHRVCGEKHAG